MTHYLLSVHSANDASPRQMTDEEMRRGYELVATLETEMRAAGAFVMGARLDAPTMSRVVRPSKSRPKATDGPYAETKEHLAGFYILRAPDLEAALHWAEKVTRAIDAPIEVRPFAFEPTT